MHEPTIDREEMETTFWQRLLRRWFIEYNPLYLVSAALVLAGTFLTSRGLARAGVVYGGLGVAAIAEAYALALIGGAALLTRIGHRRPAVMLALLAALYQWDLTLHAETCTNLGAVGVVASFAWLALFAGKLFALAWAMKVRLARSAAAAALFAGLGLAVLPYAAQRVDPRAATGLVALWATGLVLLHRPGVVSTLAELDGWGRTVLARSVRAIWLGSALLVGLKVAFWTAKSSLEGATLLAVVPVLFTRFVRAEARVWSVLVTTLLFVALKLPGSFSVVAFVAAATLAVRAHAASRSPDQEAAPRAASGASPYRAARGDAEGSVASPTLEVVPGGRPAALRLVTGALSALYLSIWTIGWSGGAWPAHAVWLDLVVVALVVFGVVKLRAYVALAPFAAAALHLIVQARLVPAPRTSLEWGGLAVGVGFVLLVVSLAVSTWLAMQRRARSDPRRWHGR